jgi:hypothetical protein
MTYSLADLEALWIKEGGSTALAPQMAAVAMAESGGDPTGICYDYVDAEGCTRCSSTPVAGGTQADVGLWAIANIHLPAGTDPSVLTDPATNAKYAVQLAGQNGGGITSAWAAEFGADAAATKRYQTALAQTGSSVSTAVQQYLGANAVGGNSAPLAGAGNLTPATTTTTTTAAAAGTPGLFGPIIDAAKNIALEAFVGAAAIALISGGIVWLAAVDGAGSSAVKTAVKVAAA